MRVTDLTGALLDYWTARAESVPAAELELRAAGTLCVRLLRSAWGPTTVGIQVLDYSTNWALCGPLMEKHGIGSMQAYQGWYAENARMHSYGVASPGPTPSIAICRAVVRAAFGDEVEDLPCA